MSKTGQRKKFEEGEVWFTSDQHFFHNNIIEDRSRPFDDMGHMHETIMERWGETIPNDGHVFLLGDVSFNRTGYELLGSLPGHKYLILGNHDSASKAEASGVFEEIHHYKEIRIRDTETGQRQALCLFHFLIENWNNMGWGSWALHGHSHGSKGKISARARVDVGVDVWNYTPVSYQQVKTCLTKAMMQAAVDDRK